MLACRCLPFPLSNWARRVALLLCLALGLGTLSGCDLFKKKLRRFGSTCGVDAECEGGVCHEGRCTASCQVAAECESGICLDKVCQGKEADFDQDGLLNGYELAWKLDLQNADSDADGIGDQEEVGTDPLHPQDNNGDGTPDALQSNTIDADQDCLVDAWDKQPGMADVLPGAGDFCKAGVCAGAIAQVQLKCDPSKAGKVAGPAGCLGCICTAPGLAGWQGVENWCDQLDNDCDGQTDEEAAFGGLPLGAECLADAGLCAIQTIPGKVECGSDKAAICSTGAGGSKSLAQPEVCNFVDDDCDGTVDDGFSAEGKSVGMPCGGCAYTGQICANGLPMTPAHVACTADGLGAVCAGLPFASQFVQTSAGSPQPQASWSALYVPAWQRVLRYGGWVPTPTLPVERADLWTLEVPAAGKPVTQMASWQLQRHATDEPRAGAALAYDAAADRVLVLGGVHGAKTAAPVWSIGKTGPATLVSDLSTTSLLYVPPVEVETPTPPEARAHAVVLSTSGGGRVAVLIQPGLGLARTAKLGGDGTWSEVDGELGDLATCLVSDGVAGYALTPDNDLFRLDATEAGVTASKLTSDLAGPESLDDAQCAWDAAGKLHVFGLTKTKAFQHEIGTLVGKTNISWQLTTDSAPVLAALQRSGGFVGIEPVSQAWVLGGGRRIVGGHPTGIADVYSWLPGTKTVTRLDLEQPAGRIGMASGWSPARKALCLASGLRYDLGDEPLGPSRVIPATDAWCGTVPGEWTRVSENAPLFAFGMAQVDVKAERLVLAGGLPLVANQHVSDVERLWQGRLLQGGALDPTWKPVATVHTLDLKTGVLATPVSTGAPALAASSLALDPLRHRLLVFGGFDAKQETFAFWSLDLATLKWTDLQALNKGTEHPNPRMGALMVYEPFSDTIAITAGSQRHDTGSLGVDTVAGETNLGACYGANLTVLWVVTQTLGTPTFAATPLPAFADLQSNPPQLPLLRHFNGGPAFLPILFDALGGHAWLAVQQRPTEGDNSQCPNVPQQAQWTIVDHQLSLEVGTCGTDKATLLPIPAKLQDVPEALLFAAGHFIDTSSVGLVWGGIEPDGSLSASLSRLDQHCGP